MDSNAFGEHLFDSLLGTFTTLNVALGDRLGLYEVLRDHPPLTPAELAEAAGVHPRYAREWLEQQTVAGILAVDDATLPEHERRFTLPDEHVPALADPDSLAYLRPFLAATAAAASQLTALVDAYRSGGGVGWAQFGDPMRQAQGHGNRPVYLHLLGKEWLPSLPDVHAALSSGGRVADVGCGEGWSAIAMALAYPDIEVDGFDIDLASVDAANRHAAQSGVGDRVRVHHSDAAAAPAGGYDLVTAFECLHDIAAPVPVLSRMREMAGERGTVLVMDERVPDAFTGPGDPMEQLFYGFSTLVCLPDSMSHEGSAATGTVMRLGTLRQYAAAAGFTGVEVLPVEHDAFRLYRLAR